MDINPRYLRTAILLLFFIIISIPVFRILRALWFTFRDPYKEEREENTKLYNQLSKKDWGFKFVEGDLDGYPDANINLELKKPLNRREQKELTQIFKDWYSRGCEEKNKEGSEFGGLMHFMNDPRFKSKYAYFGFDFGTVGIEKALTFLMGKLSKWSRGRIVKIVLGHDEEIFNNLFPS